MDSAASPVSAMKRASMWEAKSGSEASSPATSVGTPDSARNNGSVADNRKSSSWRAPVVEKCVCCSKSVYAMEKLVADGQTYVAQPPSFFSASPGRYLDDNVVETVLLSCYY